MDFMKRLIAPVLFILIFLQGCHYTEIDGYKGGCSVYFSVQRDTMKYSWGKIDNDIKEQVLQLPIYLFGQVANYDRKIRLRTLLCEVDSLRAEIGRDFRPLPQEVFLRADTNKVIVDITLLRTEELVKHDRIFTVVIEEDSWFDSEYNWRKDGDGNSYFIGHSMTIIMNEDFPKPWWWKENDANFGEWSYKKADLICRLCDIPREEFIGNNVIPNFKLIYYGKKVQRWLNEQDPPYLDEDGSPMMMGPNAQLL